GLGNTGIVFAALKAGSIDLYPEYTGTIAKEILKLEGSAGIDELNRALAPMGFGVAVPLGFSNSYALAMLDERAQKLGIRTLSDLGKHPDLKLGLSQEFIGRGDGWPGLKAAYGWPFPTPSGLDHGLAYEAIASGKIDVMDIYTTDAKIERFRLRTLDDDRRFFPRYDAVLLYRLDVPKRFPEAWKALAKLEKTIDERKMIRMNAAAELEKRSFADAARMLETGDVPRATGNRSFFGALFAEDFWRLTGQHLLLVFVSLVASIALGVPLGIAAAKMPGAAQPILGTVGVIQTIPSLALFAFLIALLGTIGTVPAVIALFLYALLPIVRNTYAGLEGIGRGMRQAALALGLRPPERLRLIEVPLALPSILAGIKTSAVINVGTATIAAFIGAGGYGERIASGLALNDTTTLLAGAIPAAALALIVQGLFELGERKFGWMARARVAR
ncbi:MAG TPA: glycine betaine ABC transporter substrate-binding protein, partial [Burkholderiales bacterium]|nr:glycine betaine ABC transporter substrate-binding protein [Burkholderiales bacterium]